MTHANLADMLTDYIINCGLNLAAFDINSAYDYICKHTDIFAFEYYSEGAFIPEDAIIFDDTDLINDAIDHAQVSENCWF